MMNKERLGAFSDAIIAIVVTILVLEIKVPEEITWHTLAGQWHVYFAYITSFIVLYGTWYNHQTLFEWAKTVNVKVFWANGLWILSLSFIPYVTEMVGDHPNDFLPEFLYLLMNFVRLVAFQFLGRTVRHANHTNLSTHSRRYFVFSHYFRFGTLLMSMIACYWFPMIGLIWTFALVTTYIWIAIRNENRNLLSHNNISYGE